MVNVVVHNILWTKSRRLRGKIYSFLLYIVDTWVHCPLSLL